MTDRRRVVIADGGSLLACIFGRRAWSQVAPRRIAYLTDFARADAELLLGQLRAELASPCLQRRPNGPARK